jgi:NAD(P)H-dependent FMN reductase
MLKTQVIIGSTRPDRNAEQVARWVLDRMEGHGAFDVEVLDLRDWPLPMFAETLATVGDFADPTYSDPLVRRWNRKIAEGDAYLFITPEYNHSVPGVLKNAFDNVFVSFAFRNKPAAFVGYSTGVVGGARAVEHLAHIAIEAELVPLRNTVLVGEVQFAFDEEGDPIAPTPDIVLRIALDDLAWWGEATAHARREGELRPGSFRRLAALRALQDTSDSRT